MAQGPWTGLPILCLVMFGGLLTNAVWCLILTRRNASAGQWIGRGRLRRWPPTICWRLGGSLWYFQFFFYTMGESQMGRFGFSSWVLHMASIIIFGTLWGFGLKEWKGAAPKVRATVWAGVMLLIVATVIIGYGNKLGE
jgi:L-rhamnose-H+ transport protein